MAEKAMKLFVQSLEPAELKLVHTAINSFGDGQHPMSDDKTVGYFNFAYVAYCLGRQFQESNSEIQELHEGILDKMLDYTDTL